MKIIDTPYLKIGTYKIKFSVLKGYNQVTEVVFMKLSKLTKIQEIKDYFLEKGSIFTLLDIEKVNFIEEYNIRD